MKFKSEVQLEALNNATVDTDKFLVSDSSTVKYRTGAQVLSDIGGQAALTNPITGTGTLNFVSKFTSTGSTLGNSQIFDNGTSVLIGTTTPPLSNVKFLVYEPSTPTIVGYFQNNNSICYTGYHSSTTTLNAVRIGAQGNNLLFSVSSDGSPNERMRITSAGNVGIGTSSPNRLLTVAGTTSGLIALNASIYRNTTIGSDSVGNFIVYDDTAGEYRMVINSSGNVGIGTTSPSQRLDVVGAVRTTAFYQISNGPTNTGFIGSQASIFGSGGDDFTFYNGNATNNVFYTSGLERMRITSSGNVGIGTTSPSSKVSISGGTLSVSGSGAGYGVVKLGDPTDVNPYVGMYRSAAASIATSGNFLNLGGYDGIAFTTGVAQLSGQPERMRITSSGFVGIGTTAPQRALQVGGFSGNPEICIGSGTTGFGSLIFGDSASGNDPWRGFVQYNHATDAMIIGTANASWLTLTNGGALGLNVNPTNTAGRFEASNDIVAYSSSDKRWKTNIKNIDSPLDKISQINGVEFDWIEDEPVHGNKGHDIGVIAQEIEKILPDAVQTRESGMKAVKYEKVIPLLIEAVKEQQKQIEELKQLLNGITN